MVTRANQVLGVFFKDSAGVKLISFWGPSGFKTLNEVEMIAFRTGLREADKMGFRKFIVEGDSLCAIRWASGSSNPPWHLAGLCDTVTALVSK